jgi:hypothetical protein
MNINEQAEIQVLFDQLKKKQKITDEDLNKCRAFVV